MHESAISFRSLEFAIAVVTGTGATAIVTAQQATLINGGEVTMRREGPIGQGFLPDTAQFKPETWTRIP